MEHDKAQDRQGLLEPDEAYEESAVAYSTSNKGWSIDNGVSMLTLLAKTYKNILAGAGVVLLLFLGFSILPGRRVAHGFAKPPGVKVSGVVFYGRREFVDVLDCYLRKNLASNGGLLDEVLFMKNTEKEDDLAWLDKLVEQVPEYKAVDVERNMFAGFAAVWASLTENNTIYLKIDDDIVWIDDDAVPRMVETLIMHPEAHNIAGNIINAPFAGWMHYHKDAIHPFLPETSPPTLDGQPANALDRQPSDWRVNHLPAHPGNEVPDEYDFTFRSDRPSNDDGGFLVGQKGGPPYENHRWLMLYNDSEHSKAAQLARTPIALDENDSFGAGWWSWAIGAQQQYSLFKNLEDGTLDKYWFGSHAEGGTWNTQYKRYNLNFLAIWGSSVAMQLPGWDDENDMTSAIPKQLHRPCLIDTRALVSHFSFHSQPEILHTDLLDRYRLYANEFVCTADNQKKRLS